MPCALLESDGFAAITQPFGRVADWIWIVWRRRHGQCESTRITYIEHADAKKVRLAALERLGVEWDGDLFALVEQCRKLLFCLLVKLEFDVFGATDELT